MKDKINTDVVHLILGFGLTGLSIARALTKIGVTQIWAMDSRAAPPNQEEMSTLCTRVICGRFDHDLLDRCEYLWLSPGVSLATPEVQQCIKRLPADHIGGDIELFARLVHGSVIGITGTNGKSTVTTLIGDMFKVAGRETYVGGNLGEPALALWMASEDAHRRSSEGDQPVFVLELSSFQLETTSSLNMEVGVILNIAPDHLDRYPSLAEYAAAKFRLFQQSANWVSNADDHLLADYIHQAGDSIQGKIVTFSIQNTQQEGWHITKCDGNPRIEYQDLHIDIATIPMGGLHNIANVMASGAVAQLAGISIQDICQAVRAYQPLPHRCVLVRTFKGVRYYNDSKATNLPSTAAAIRGFPESKWLILGGLTKNQDFSSLSILLKENVRKVVLIGVDTHAIQVCIPEVVPFEVACTLDKAVEIISEEAAAGDVVLFSPACASMDQFKDYNERGERFTEYVKALV